MKHHQGLRLLTAIGAAILLMLPTVNSYAAPGYSVSVTPTSNLQSGGQITVTVDGLSGSLGVYASVCLASDSPNSIPTVCDMTATAWIANGRMGSTTSPAKLTVRSEFEGKVSPSASTTTAVNCTKQSCVLYVRGDHNNNTDYSLIRVIPLAFKSGGRVRIADSATASYGTTTLQPNQAGTLAYRTPIKLRVTTASGSPVTLTSLTPDCAVTGKTVTALKGVGVCAIAATTKGDAMYLPLTVNFPFYLRLATQTIHASWPTPLTRKVGSTLRIRGNAFKTNMEQPVTVTSASTTCQVRATDAGWTVTFSAVGDCVLTATAAAREGKWTSATSSQTYVSR